MADELVDIATGVTTGIDDLDMTGLTQATCAIERVGRRAKGLALRVQLLRAAHGMGAIPK